MQDPTKQERESFFPDFGSAQFALRILVVAQCMAIILTIARNSNFDEAAWNDLILMTSFAQLIGIGSVIVLHLVSRPVKSLGVMLGSLVLFSLLLLTAFFVSEGIIFALYRLDITADRWPDWHWSLVARTLIISAIISALALRYAFIQHRAQMESEAKQQGRLQALQSRIRPHFLFNSMNSVASLIRSNPELAEKALQDLADVFRVLLADARKMVPISAEGELARQYLDIEKLRLGERLQVKWSAVNVPRTALIPSLTLQPLIEKRRLPRH